MITYEEAISSGNGLDTNSFIRNAVQELFNPVYYEYHDISNFKKRLRFKQFPMAVTYDIAITKEKSVVAVMSVCTFNFMYTADLEMIMDRCLVSCSKKRELHLFRNKSWAAFIQVDRLQGYSVAVSTTDYSSKDFLETVYHSYCGGLSRTS